MESSQSSELIIVSLYAGDSGLSVGPTLEQIEFEDTGLSPDLVEDLKQWATLYRESFNDNWEWKTPELERGYTEQASALAQRIADELGDEHEVQYQPNDGNSPPMKFQASGQGSNPQAITALAEFLQGLRDQEAQHMQQVETAAGEGFEGSVGWWSNGPLSDITIDIVQPDDER